MRIAWIHDWKVNYQQELDWQDGLSAALNELENRGHKVVRFADSDEAGTIPNPLGRIIYTPDIIGHVRDYQPDVILCWADMTRQNCRHLAELGIPMAICFAGGNVLGENVEFFDHIFVESKVYKESLNNAGYDNVSIAFGANTDLFVPISQHVSFDTIFPATFAIWKRHKLYSRATVGLRSLAVGYIYTDHEQECWQECLKNDTTILPHVSAETLHYLYAASKVCVIPSRSDGGSQRTVLEAMAMNLPVIVCDSDKFDYEHLIRVEPTAEAIRTAIDATLDTEINTRDYVLENWSHIQYANKLEKGLESICS